MEEEPKRTRTTSLRWRLIAVSLAMLTLALVALDAAIYLGLRQRYYSDLRANVMSAVAQAKEITPDMKRGPSALATTLSTSNVITFVYRPGSYPVVGNPAEFRLSGLPPIAGPPLTWDDSWGRLMMSVTSSSHFEWKTTSMLPRSSDSVLFVANKVPIERTLRRLLIAELLGTLLVLGLAVFLVALAVRFALRPLNRMAVVAGRIAAGETDQRLRPSKPATDLGKLAAAFDAMVASLAASLTSEREASERARSSEERMRVFLSDASHELRTPIAGLQWSAEALLRHGQERARREELSFQIAKQARRASKLVGDLLAIARLERGVTLDLEQFDLAELAEEEIERVREQEPGLELRLSSENGCPLVADAERVRQVISNLIDNARKATAGRGEIGISVRRGAKSVELEVHDSGPGIPEDDRERIFERFVRLDDARLRSDDYGFGSGLGLAIARGIAEAHGGSLICAESDAGARFVLTLPLGGRSKREVSQRVARARDS
jgi:two-component system OmpR family sensor kinase